MRLAQDIYPNVEDSIYRSLDAANYSTLKQFRRSAAHARESLLNPPDQTAAMKLGSATHIAVLEPMLFDTLYAVAPKVDRRFKKDKIIWEEFLKDNADKEVLTSAEWDQCRGMSDSALENPLVSELVFGKGHTELSFVWLDKDTDEFCKGRIDRFGRLWGHSVIADLKTTENASPDAWAREVVKYQYHAQAAFYLDGLDTVSPVVDRRFIWIAIEKKPPYAVAIYEPDAATMDKGRRMYRNYLRQWKACRESGIWMGYDAAIQPLLIPEWALRQEEGEDEF
jgi:exodeoxyribonuclease VIII